MSGTSFSVTAATRFRPPMTMSAVTTMRARPVTMVGTPKAAFMLPAMELSWLMLPMPKDARMQKQANSTASTLPSCLQPFFAPRPSVR